MRNTTGEADSIISIRCLFVEDQDDDAALLIAALQRNGFRLDHLRVETMDGLKNALLKDWDIVFSDHSLPTMNGVEALKIVRERNKDVPFIFVSGTIGEDVAVDAMRNGAQDYIMKDNLKRLIPAVRRELKDSYSRKEKREAEERLHYLTHFDSLTGLPNRFDFLEELQQLINERGTDSDQIPVLHINLDRFKSVNDGLGYEAGNILLREVSVRLNICVYRYGVVARLASDEYAIFLHKVKHRDEVSDIAKKIMEVLEEPYSIRGCSSYLSASVGICFYPQDAKKAADLLSCADIATNKVKDQGGKGYRFYTSAMTVQLEERVAIERNMRQGLDNNEFHLHYQPQIELNSGRLVGVEALLRWNSAERGAVSPADFIPLAEDTGFIIPLSEWVIERACSEIKNWHAQGYPKIRVAINISARQFHEEELPRLIKSVLNRYQLAADYIELEITETTIIQDIDRALESLAVLKNLGVNIALDDFGTGYSSLSYLNQFKTDYLKIDQSFIRQLPQDRNSFAIVSAIIAMSERLGIKTIAEGVESLDQYNLLREVGCNFAQGFYMGRPMPLERLRDWLDDNPLGVKYSSQ